MDAISLWCADNAAPAAPTAPNTRLSERTGSIPGPLARKPTAVPYRGAGGSGGDGGSDVGKGTSSCTTSRDCRGTCGATPGCEAPPAPGGNRCSGTGKASGGTGIGIAGIGTASATGRECTDAGIPGGIAAAALPPGSGGAAGGGGGAPLVLLWLELLLGAAFVARLERAGGVLARLCSPAPRDRATAAGR
mmetsp:Transcript_28714/g.86937  ORF Transcript_28714/g.86937 Transcript_28714/m.86937 type:complete len:191 (-) Transcript_28714:99-671(-)